MATYCIEVMRGPRPTFIVNGKAVGTTISSVRGVVVGPALKMIADACRTAKEDGVAVTIDATVLGWRSYVKLT